jgi:hypothetical protein
VKGNMMKALSQFGLIYVKKCMPKQEMKREKVYPYSFPEEVLGFCMRTFT